MLIANVSHVSLFRFALCTEESESDYNLKRKVKE